MCRPLMRALGMEPKTPAMPAVEAPPPPPAPVVQDVGAQMQQVDAAAQEAERRRARNANGRASTILTGGMGDQSTPELARPAATGQRMLLG